MGGWLLRSNRTPIDETIEKTAKSKKQTNKKTKQKQNNYYVVQ